MRISLTANRYTVDGNALFLTATEITWRHVTSPHFVDGAVVVGIGYPLPQGNLYDLQRRTFDFTPPTAEPIEGFGGANKFLDFIQGTVKAAVHARLPKVSASREVLYGHSFGGLFALHALFTRPTAFDYFIASSPSIWWNDSWIIEEAQQFVEASDPIKSSGGEEPKPGLMLSWGAMEQDPPKKWKQSQEKWKARKKVDGNFRIVDNALELAGLLRGSKLLRRLSCTGFDGEDHTTVMSCSLNRGLMEFFEDWPDV